METDTKKIATLLALIITLVGQPVFAGGDAVDGAFSLIELGGSSIAVLVEARAESSFHFSSDSLAKYSSCRSILILFEGEVEAIRLFREEMENQLALDSEEVNVDVSLEFLASNGSDVRTNDECSIYTHFSEGAIRFDERPHLVVSLGFPDS